MYIWQLIIKGGYVMWPIIACSFISIAIFFERMQYYKSVKGNVKHIVIDPIDKINCFHGKRELMESAGSLLVSQLNRYLNYLETIVTISPLLGLLGTVTGMISSFDVLSTASGQPFAITGGVSEALIATATGLCVAIIALCLHSILLQYQNGIVDELEVVCDEYTKVIARSNHNEI